MKDLENHHIGHGEPLRHADEERDPGREDYGMEAAQALSAFGCLGTCIMILIVLLIGLCSCTPRVVKVREEVPVYLHDTITNSIIRVDSFVERDSIYFETFIKGDTVSTTKYVEKWRTKVELKHDTAVKIVEVPVSYTEVTEVEVPAKLTTWDKTRMRLGEFGICVILISLILIIYKYARAYAKNK